MNFLHLTRQCLLATAFVLAATGAAPAAQSPPAPGSSPEAEAVLLYVSDTYGCLGYPDWPGGVSRHKLFAARERQAHPGALFIHTGNALSPFYFSRYDRGEFYAGALDSVENVVWNLGFHDLDFGWKRLSELRKMMRSTSVIGSNLQAPSDPPQPWLVREVGGLKIGFLGLMEPQAPRLTVVGSFDGMAIADPVATAREILAKHRSEVDVAVAVADLAEDDAERLAREVTGLDLVLGGSRHARDWYTFFEGRSASEVVLRTRPDGSRTMYLSGPRDGFELAKVTIRARREGGRWKVSALEPSIVPLPKDAPADPGLWPRVQAQLKKLEADGGAKILAQLKQRFPEGLDGKRFSRWVVSALRESVSAEVGVMNEGALFKADFHAGLCTRDDAVTALYLDNIFWAPNHVVKLRLLGKNLLQVVEDGKDGKLLFSGLTQENGQVSINGRPLKPEQHYLVAATNYLVDQSPKSRGFAAAQETQQRFRKAGGRLQPATGGEQVSLGSMFREQLERWGKAHPKPDGAEPFSLSPYPRQRTVDFRGVNMTVSDFDARHNENFKQVRNPRIATPDVRTVMGGGEVLVRDETRDRAWDTGARFSYQGFKFRNTPVYNPVDDLLLYSRYVDRSRTLGGQLFSLTFHPYAELANDSEFTATRGNPKQNVVRTSLGASGSGPGQLDELRLAAFREYDLHDEYGTDGVSLYYRFRKPFWGVRFESDADVRYYFDTSRDGRDDLQYEAYSNNQIVVPITDGFSVTFMGNLFLYRGKVIEETGSNLFLGVGLRFDKLWKPAHEAF